MTWNSVNDFIGMGGYALYVWGSYGAGFLLLTAEILAVCRRRRAAFANLRQMHALEKRES
jgi:heme exporter protein D